MTRDNCSTHAAGHSQRTRASDRDPQNCPVAYIEASDFRNTLASGPRAAYYASSILGCLGSFPNSRMIAPKMRRLREFRMAPMNSYKKMQGTAVKAFLIENTIQRLVAVVDSQLCIWSVFVPGLINDSTTVLGR